MFQGTIPAEMRAIVHEHARAWDTEHVYVGCSGNFTIDRALADLGRFKLHGNDVTLYSCSIGRYTAGEKLNVFVSDHYPEWQWMEDYLDGKEGTVATLMLASEMLKGLGKPGAYWRRMQNAYRNDWPKLHAKTREKVLKSVVPLESFYAGDVVDYMAAAPEDAAVVSFPPFFKGGYEVMFKNLEEVFLWEEPEYVEMDEGRKELTFRAMASKRHWLFATNAKLNPEWDANLVGHVQTSVRNVPFWVYSNGDSRRVAEPRTDTEPVLVPRLGDDEAPQGPLTLHPLRPAQFRALRAQYLNQHIKPGEPTMAVGVCAGGKLVGAYAYSTAETLTSSWGAHLPSPCVYLMSDFPVSGKNKLAKLVLMASVSKEAKLLAERAANARVRSVATTAFTQKPVSMKYRGVYKLIGRRDAEEPWYKFKLSYGSEMGRWSLSEALKLWRERYASNAKKEAA